jgi:hypothetical protein
MEIWIHRYGDRKNGDMAIETWRHRHGILTLFERTNWKMEAQGILLYLCFVCLSCKWMFFVCLFVNKETNGSYPFGNGLNRLNGLNGLAHLCQLICEVQRWATNSFLISDNQ